MESVIVEMVIAATGTVSDYMLPAHVAVDALLGDLVKLVEQVHQEITFAGEKPILCCLTNRRILPGNLTLAQAGVRDSYRLMLV